MELQQPPPRYVFLCLESRTESVTYGSVVGAPLSSVSGLHSDCHRDASPSTQPHIGC